MSRSVFYKKTKKIASLFLLCLFFFKTSLAQSNASFTYVKTLENKCAALAKQEDYTALLKSARAGYLYAIHMKDTAAASLFSYYAGASYDDANKADSALYFYRLSELLAYTVHSPERFTTAQIKTVAIYYNKGEPDSVSVYEAKMLSEIKTLTNDSLKINLYKSIANIYVYKNEYDEAVTAYLHVVHYDEQLKDTIGIAIAWVNIGNAYLQMSNSAKALPYFLQALPYLANYEYGQVICSDNIGCAYTNLFLYDSAIVYHEKALSIAKKIKDTSDIYAAGEKMSAAFIGKKEYEKAEKYLQPALQYALSSNSATEIIDGEDLLGQAEAGKKNYQTSLAYFLKALRYSQQTKHDERTNELLKSIASAADSVRNYSMAAKYYAQYILLNDSLTKESSKKTTAELETKYQTEQKEQQIKLLDQQSKTQLLALHEQRIGSWFLMVAVAFVAVVVTLFLRYRSRINQLKKLTEMRNNISRDLHDEIGATLSSINIYSEVAKTKLQHEDEVKKLLERIHDGSAQMMESMSDIVWYVNPKNDSAETLIVKMREYAAPVLEAKNIRLQFTCANDIKLVKLAMLQRQNFYLLFKEAINNIAKYAQAANTLVAIDIAAGNILLTIKDDGKGFDMNNYKPGNGLMNIRQRAKLLKGNCIISSEVNKGTSVEINFPVSL